MSSWTEEEDSSSEERDESSSQDEHSCGHVALFSSTKRGGADSNKVDVLDNSLEENLDALERTQDALDNSIINVEKAGSKLSNINNSKTIQQNLAKAEIAHDNLCQNDNPNEAQNLFNTLSKVQLDNGQNICDESKNSSDLPYNSQNITDNSDAEDSLQLPDNSHELPDNSIKLLDKSIELPDNYQSIANNSDVEDNSLELPDNSLELPDNSLELPDNSLTHDHVNVSSFDSDSAADTEDDYSPDIQQSAQETEFIQKEFDQKHSESKIDSENLTPCVENLANDHENITENGIIAHQTVLNKNILQSIDKLELAIIKDHEYKYDDTPNITSVSSTDNLKCTNNFTVEETTLSKIDDCSDIKIGWVTSDTTTADVDQLKVDEQDCDPSVTEFSLFDLPWYKEHSKSLHR